MFPRKSCPTCGARMHALPVRLLMDDELSLVVASGAFVCVHAHAGPVQAHLLPA